MQSLVAIDLGFGVLPLSWPQVTEETLMSTTLEVDPSKYTRKRVMVTLRVLKSGDDPTPQVLLEAEDGSGVAVAIFGADSPAARADAARVMVLWNGSL